tara:strand:+ start:11095 stop:11352 length:258 start_codon:yes stop_codon:yes gene_type:complete
MSAKLKKGGNCPLSEAFANQNGGSLKACVKKCEKKATKSPKAKKPLTDYTKFVRSTAPGIKAKNPTMKQTDVIKAVAKLWREQKA